MLCLDGMPDFNALHSGKHNAEVQLWAFDVLAVDGDDLRDLSLSMRKANLDRRGRPDGIFVNPFEQGAIGPDLLRAVWCQRSMGEAASVGGLVVKRRRQRPHQRWKPGPAGSPGAPSRSRVARRMKKAADNMIDGRPGSKLSGQHPACPGSVPRRESS